MTIHKILVVDDSPTELAHIKTIVADSGYTVLTAANGQEAVDKAKVERPDLIFLDIVMPQLDGFATCRVLGTDNATKDIPVVFVTCKNQKADRVWAQMQGAKGYITKPYDADAIIDQIRVLQAASSMEKSAPATFSHETVQMMMELKNRLRQYGLAISLTDRHAALHLINASAQIDDHNIKQLRTHLVRHLPEVQSLYLVGESQTDIICGQCERMLPSIEATPPEQYVACSCGKLFLLILGNQRASLRQARLPGVYRREGEDSRIGEMVVEDLSCGGARIRSLVPHTIGQNDRLIISFTLDDLPQTVVHTTVSVTHVNDDIIGVRFVDISALDHSLATYLGISWVRT